MILFKKASKFFRIIKKFYNKCERFLRPYRTYFFMAFAYNEDRATQRCDSSAL